MGSGKSSVASECARLLGWPFVDTDAAVEADAGCTVAEIFAREGEAAFRAREREQLARACAANEPSVIACGGGAVLDVENREAMKVSGLVVWLTASPEVLTERVGDGSERPLFGDDPRGALERLAAERADAYAEVAEVAVDTSQMTIDDVAAEVISVVGRARAAPQSGRWAPR
ncbi:MAG: shikimate kinase [Actinobacteria bacterium]|nr:shikimate kinase [Actinomycetota bacterium]